MEKFITLKTSLLIFIVLGFLVFFNLLSNGFVWDDKEQIIKPSIIHDIRYIPLILITSVHANSTDSFFSFYYKPLMFALFNFIYWVFGENPFPFHFFQISIHILNSFLIFYLFKKIFSKEIALFLGIIFLVHPINQGTVAYISALQDVLFLFFGLIALIIAFEKKKLLTKHYFLICLLLFLSLLSKETGIVFVFATSILVFFNKSLDYSKYLFSVFIMGVVYFCLRFISSNYFFLYKNDFSLNNFSFLEKILNIPYILYFYLKELFLPISTILPLHTTLIKNFSFLEIFINLSFVFLFGLFLYFLGRNIYKNNKKSFPYYLLFLGWFVFGIFIHLQIISLDTAVANRWLYSPLVGFLGIVGLTVNILIKSNSSFKKIISILFIVIIILFSLQTITMNSYWKNQEALNSHLEENWH